MRGVNSNPRRWADPSARVRVIEGWHPSMPDRVGYNLLVDGDWIGTFESLESAADEATRQLAPGPHRVGERHQVTLLPWIEPGSSGPRGV